MSREMASMVARELGMPPELESLLLRNIRTLNKEDRKIYFQTIKPREREIKNFLYRFYIQGCDIVKEGVLSNTVDSMLEKKGDPDLVDGMVMDVVGRITVYNKMREKSESEGIKLSAMTSFGGLSMVLFAVVIITALILYLSNS